jgi:hypothetical protein
MTSQYFSQTKPLYAWSTSWGPLMQPKTPLLMLFILWLCRVLGRPAVNKYRWVKAAWPPVSREDVAVIQVGMMFFVFAIGILAMLLARG